MAGLVAADHMFELDAPLFELAAELEGHPDNVAAALHGGFVICAGGEPVRFDPPAGLEAVLARPAAEVPTAEARAALPAEVPIGDAVHNVAHAALLVLGLARDDLSLVARGLSDRIHQPRRRALYPESMDLVDRAADLGAVGATISGAGPTVLFWCHWQATGALVERLRGEVPGWDVAPRHLRPRRCGRDGAVSDEIQAAGGLVVRDGEVLARAPAALRGLVAAEGQARPGRDLGGGGAARGGGGGRGALPPRSASCRDVHYEHKGRPKRVRYWLMEPVEDEPPFAPNDEVDEVRWVSPEDALELLSYERDRELLGRGLARPQMLPDRGTHRPAQRGARLRRGQLGPAVGPRARRLELRAQRQQRGLVGRAAGQLDGQRQAVVAVEERQRDRRLAAHVERGRVGREVARAAEVVQRVCRCRRRSRRSATGRSPSAGVRIASYVSISADPGARDGLELGPREQVVHPAALLDDLPGLPRERLDEVLGRLAAGQQAAEVDRRGDAGPEDDREGRQQVAAPPRAPSNSSTSWPSDASRSAASVTARGGHRVELALDRHRAWSRRSAACPGSRAAARANGSAGGGAQVASPVS